MTCHYSLANLTGPPHRCPECGREFDPNNPGTVVRTSRRERAIWRALIWIGAAYVVNVVVVWALFAYYMPKFAHLWIVASFSLLTTFAVVPLILTQLAVSLRRKP